MGTLLTDHIRRLSRVALRPALIRVKIAWQRCGFAACCYKSVTPAPRPAGKSLLSRAGYR
jgi:hypothetical protein